MLNNHFPKAVKYHSNCIKAPASGDANSLCLAECLSASLTLKPKMKVLTLAVALRLLPYFFIEYLVF
jgi:hypothetical protein